jgi:Asp-tRNA(Asn)/Glu-tRNA(Gln) amidotransferase A subunit family amidase
MTELLQGTLIELTEALRARRVSPVELMEAVFARIDQTNPDLNAIVSERDRAQVLEEARAAEARIAAGDARPLEGIPFGVKDLEDVAGMVTSQGSVLFKDAVAARDEVHVERLRAAGAIPIAKTNAPEFGPTAITKNLLHGVTRNPWNLERTPGGSSGGSSAALAGCVLPMVTASDGGGSIRIPASWTGAFGLKTSYGRVPKGPAKYWDTGATGVYGPLTKTVEDAALYLDQIAGPSPHDASALPHPGISYLEAVRAEAPAGLRIGFSPDLGRAVVQSDVAAAVEEAVKVFEKLGHKLEAIADGPPPQAQDWMASAGWGLASRIHERLEGNEDKVAYYILEMIRAADEMTPEKWGDMQRTRAQVCAWCAELFERCDLLVTPTVAYDPVPAKGPFPEETEGRKQEYGSSTVFTMPFNLSWHPAATVRAGLSKAGLPVGMQIVAPLHRDDLALQLSRAFERERPWHPHWPTG